MSTELVTVLAPSDFSKKGHYLEFALSFETIKSSAELEKLFPTLKNAKPKS